jgi:hypothetical protein
MPRDAAAARLTELIDALPGATADAIPSRMIADLVALLPKGRTLDVRPSDSGQAAGLRGSQVLIALSALAVMMLIVCAISAILSPGPANGANPPPPRGDDASMFMPRR